MEEIRKKLKVIKEAIQDWEKGKLSDLAALTAINMIIDSRELPEEAIQWAINTIKNNGGI